MKKVLLLLTFTFSLLQLQADYLITSRAANVKEDPSSAASTLEHVDKGVALNLLNQGIQTNGYYAVVTANGNTGWIYRTLVRRYAGEMVGFPAITGLNLVGGARDVEVTVIDVGAGLSCFIKLPKNKFIVYDGGRLSAMTYLENTLPIGTEIEYLVLSHTDADHWGAVEKIITRYKVKNVIRTAYRKNEFSDTYKKGVDAIENADYEINDYNLEAKGDLEAGKLLYTWEGVKLYALCGFKQPPVAWGNLSDSKANNAVSIVVRLEYQGNSILFGGDAVGRDDCAPDGECIATEKFLIDNVNPNLLNADVIVVPHHGADNASCQTFISKVSPEYVVFSAGHAYHHPRQITAERYMNVGVDPVNIYRTDRGDFESSSGEACNHEWSYGESSGNDSPGDDDVRIVLPDTGTIRIGYLN